MPACPGDGLQLRSIAAGPMDVGRHRQHFFFIRSRRSLPGLPVVVVLPAP